MFTPRCLGRGVKTGHVVAGGDPVGGDEQEQSLVSLVDLADLAGIDMFHAVLHAGRFGPVFAVNAPRLTTGAPAGRTPARAAPRTAGAGTPRPAGPHRVPGHARRLRRGVSRAAAPESPL